MADEAIHTTGDRVLSKKTLDKMDKPELVAIGQQWYGLRIPIETIKRDMIDILLNAAIKFKGNAEMRVVPEDAKVEVPKGYVKIKVQPGEHNPRKRPIIVGMNFKLASIPVNQAVIMEGKWLPCLEDAIEVKYFEGVDEDGKHTLDWSDQPKYPYSILVDNR
jgi:hypothetical protein